MVILDTNIIIDHLSTKSNSSILLNLKNKLTTANLAISVISIQELYEGESTRIKEEEKLLMAYLNSLNILSYTDSIAVIAGKIMRDSKIDITFPDAAIAATAITNNSQLVTLNQRHFKNIRELSLYKI